MDWSLLLAGHGALLIQRVRLEGRGTNEREYIGNEANTGAVFRVEPAD